MKKMFLSYVIKENTPTYGNRNKFVIEKKSSIKKGDIANNSYIKTTVHIGTHLDMPYHFYENGQTIEDFDINFFESNKVLYIKLKPNELIIKDELISLLEKERKRDYEFLIVNTSIWRKRDSKEFWEENFGFAPDIADYLRKEFPKIRIIGIDSISISSFQDRILGREAHKKFLNPKKPILIVEDMKLKDSFSKIHRLQIIPLRIEKCDGLPCTVIGEVA